MLFPVCRGDCKSVTVGAVVWRFLDAARILAPMSRTRQIESASG